MSDDIDPELSATLTELSQGRATGARLKDGVLSMVLDVGGLDEATREALSERIKRAALLSPEVEHVRFAMTAEKAARPLILAVGSGKGGRRQVDARRQSRCGAASQGQARRHGRRGYLRAVLCRACSPAKA